MVTKHKIFYSMATIAANIFVRVLVFVSCIAVALKKKKEPK